MPHSVHSTRESTPVSDHELGVKYWNTNIPSQQWTEECPQFLAGTSGKDQNILSRRDEDFRVFTWQEVKYLIATNRIDQFQRPPLQLRRYLKFMHDIKKRHGSTMSFVQKRRLLWSSATPSSAKSFTNPEDYKILYNDWPYGLDRDIIHLVVWTKFPLADDPATDDLTPEARQEIEDFVFKTFCDSDGIPREQLVWFKNWSSLKSIHALEHFHVMLYRPSAEFVQRVTEGDQPMSVTMKD